MKLNGDTGLFTVSGCITERALLDFLDRKLSDADRLLVEEHLAGCLFCSDASEGLESIGDRERVRQELTALRFGVGEKILSRSPFVESGPGRLRWKPVLTYLSIAASLALLVVSFAALLNMGSDKTSKEVSQQIETAGDVKNPNSESKEITGEEQAAGKSTISEKPQILVDYYEGKDEQIILTQSGSGGVFYDSLSATKNEITTDRDNFANGYTTVPVFGNSDDKSTEILESEDVISDLSVAEEKSAESSKRKEDRNSKQNNKNSGGITSGKKAETRDENDVPGRAATQTVADGAAGASIDPFSAAYSLYTAGKYQEAITAFEQILTTSPSNDAARYYCALSLHELGNNLSALEYLGKITTDKTSSFYDLAQWQIALIYLDTNDLVRARVVLNEIIKEKGSFKKSASDKLDEIGR